METTTKERRTVMDAALETYAGVLRRHIARMRDDGNIPWLEAGRQWPRDIWDEEHSCGNALVLMMHMEEKGWHMPEFIPAEWMEEGMPDKWRTKDDCLEPVVARGEGKPFPLLFDTLGPGMWGGSDWESPFKDDYFAHDARDLHVHPTDAARRWVGASPVYCIEATNIRAARPRLYAACVGAWYAEWRSDAAARRLALLDRMVAEGRWVCKINEGGDDEACYNIRTDEITVPGRERFADKAMFYGMLLHELVHSTGADKRRDRFVERKGWGVTKDFYAREELIAELAAALIANRMGIAKHLKNESASYANSWLDALETQEAYLPGVLVEVEGACRSVFRRLAAMA